MFNLGQILPRRHCEVIPWPGMSPLHCAELLCTRAPQNDFFRYLIFVFLKCSMRMRKFATKRAKLLIFNFFLSQKIISISEIIFCHIIVFLLQKLFPVTKLLSVTETFFSITEASFCHRHFCDKI